MIVAPPGFTTARRPPPRWGRRVAIVFVVLLLGALAGWWFSKGPVEAAVQAKLFEVLQRRGFTVSIAGVDWNRATRLKLTGVKLERADMSVAIDAVDVQASGHYLVRGDVRIVAVAIGAVDATVRTGVDAPTRARSAGGTRSTLLAPGASVSIARLNATLMRGGKPLAALDLMGPAVALDPSEISVVGQGTLAFAGRRAPVHFEARRGGGVLSAEARSTDESTPLIALTDPAHGAVRIGGGAIERRDGRLQLEARAVTARFGPKDAPVVRVSAARVGYSPARGVHLETGAAQAWGDPRRALPHARALYRSWRGTASTATGGIAAPTVTTRRVEMKGFELILTDGWRMTEATLKTDGETVDVDGIFGGGRLTLHLEKDRARVAAQAVRLDGKWGRIPLSGVLSGQVAVERSPLRLVVDGSVAAGALHHPAIAETPLKGIDAGFKGAITIDKGRIGFEKARVRLGKAVAEASLTIGGLPADPLTLRDGWPDSLRPVIDLRAEVDPIRCQDAVAGVPAALLGPVRDVELSGVFRPKIRLRLPFRDPKKVRFTATGISKGGCEVDALNLHAAGRPPADVAAPLDDVAWLDADFVLPVREGVSDGAQIQVGPGTADYVRLEDMPGYVGGAAYLSEEMGFYTGTGISLPLIAKALGTNLTRRRFAYGGSTVTQQLVKNLFLTRRKTLARKLQEAIIAARIARRISKDRVLELYLNCIEFGPDLYGIGPAAAHYFQKSATDLTPLEAVFLAMLKPAPRRGAWYRRQGRTPKMPYWDQRVRLLLERLEARELAPAGTADQAVPYILRWAKDGRYLGPDQPVIPAPSPLERLP